MSFGKRMKAARQAAGLSQEEVARRARLGLRAVGELERERATDPHLSSVIRIANALGVPVENLLEERAVQEWAREQGARLHGMTDAEFNTHVRTLDSVRIEQEYRALLEEAGMLHTARSIYKWQSPEGEDRREALSRDLRELVHYRAAELAAAAKLRKADELFREITRDMEYERVPF